MAVIDTQETLSEAVPGVDHLRATLEDVLAQLTTLSERVAGLEQLASMGGAEAGPVAPVPLAALAPAEAVQSSAAPSSLAVAAGITEEEVLAISAAVAAWLGVHAHIRQIRLIRTGAWAQQGRVTIQASHRLHY
jgi:methylmalonyl-CoA carboxyltransferase large subunit